MRTKIIPWFYKWLPIIFGCHCLTERTLIIKNRKMPICARCFGQLIGIIIAIIYIIVFKALNWKISLLLCVPLIVDGFLQLLTSYTSNNPLRVFTGVLFGFGFTSFNLTLINLLIH